MGDSHARLSVIAEDTLPLTAASQTLGAAAANPPALTEFSVGQLDRAVRYVRGVVRCHTRPLARHGQQIEVASTVEILQGWHRR
jgi:hypothetical protein